MDCDVCLTGLVQQCIALQAWRQTLGALAAFARHIGHVIFEGFFMSMATLHRDAASSCHGKSATGDLVTDRKRKPLMIRRNMVGGKWHGHNVC